MGEPIVAFAGATPERIAAAVHAVVVSDGVRAARLKSGAAQSIAEAPADLDSARWFQSLVELGFLIASADGFADSERSALAGLLELVTSETIDKEMLELHLSELEQQVDVMGRTQRLARAAGELDDPSAADDAVAFAALVAMADGHLGGVELDALVELGGVLSIPADRVRSLALALAGEVEAQLR
jgi:tellurite resistance protein